MNGPGITCGLEIKRSMPLRLRQRLPDRTCSAHVPCVVPCGCSLPRCVCCVCNLLHMCVLWAVCCVVWLFAAQARRYRRRPMKRWTRSNAQAGTAAAAAAAHQGHLLQVVRSVCLQPNRGLTETVSKQPWPLHPTACCAAAAPVNVLSINAPWLVCPQPQPTSHLGEERASSPAAWSETPWSAPAMAAAPTPI